MTTLRYAVLVEPSENGFGAYVPDVPGCAALGDSFDETMQLVREAIELHNDGMRKDGLEIPAPKTVCNYVTFGDPRN